MSCNGYHRLKWYYTYPQHPYKWTSIRGQDLIEFDPRGCECGQNCQCPCCPYRQQRMQQLMNQSQPSQQPPQQPPQQPVQSQSQAGGCGCSL